MRQSFDARTDDDHRAVAEDEVVSRHDGKVNIANGPSVETIRDAGEFWVLETADLDEALAW
jgi:hypothetical protein